MDFSFHTKVDEDEGSPFRNGVNLFGGQDHQIRKIERSAEAFRVRHTRHIFPSKDNFADNIARAIMRSIGNGWQISSMSLRKAHFATKHSQHEAEDCFERTALLWH